jgi:hypothetical protein
MSAATWLAVPVLLVLMVAVSRTLLGWAMNDD